MSQTVVVNGVSYDIPDVGEDGWGQNVTDYLVALSVVAGATPALINVVSVTTTPVTILVGRTYLVDTSSAKTLQLPAATSNFFFIVRDVTGSAATNNITIARNGSESIDGVASNKTLSRPYGTWLIISNGTNWFTLNQFPDTGIINADVASAAAIAYSKLNLGTSIVNADISASAAIAYAKLAALTFSRALVSSGAGVVEVSAVTSTELGYLSGVTSAIQTQLGTKAPTASPTFSGTITTPLTASRAVVTGASSELAVSAATATEVGYLSGVTSAIQTQMNLKAPLASPSLTGTVTVTGTGGTDFVDLIGGSAGTIGIRIGPSGASSNSAKIIATLNGANTDLAFGTAGANRLTISGGGSGEIGIGVAPEAGYVLKTAGYAQFTNVGDTDPVTVVATSAGHTSIALTHYGSTAALRIRGVADGTTTALNILAGGSLRMAISSQTGYLTCLGVYAQTTASAANVVVDSSGNIMRSTSARKYKKEIVDLPIETAREILRMETKIYKSKSPSDDPETLHYGLIADDIAHIDPVVVSYFKDESGVKIPDGVQYDRITVPLLKVVQSHDERLTDIEKKLMGASK